MEGSRFDAWTRRRFGLAAGGVAGSLFGLLAREAAESKKKKRKRCIKVGKVCKQGGKRKCCGKLKCRLVENNVGLAFHCCKSNGVKCGNPTECCSGFCNGVCDNV
jgi:hypothetical protein